MSTLLLSLLACSPVEIGAKAYRRPAASPVEDSGHTDCSSLPLTEEPRAQNLVLLTWDTTRRRSDGAAVWSTPLAEAVAEQDEYPNYAVEVGSGGLAVRVGDKLFGIPL